MGKIRQSIAPCFHPWPMHGHGRSMLLLWYAIAMSFQLKTEMEDAGQVAVASGSTAH